jgi:hypothetical protein
MKKPGKVVTSVGLSPWHANIVNKFIPNLSSFVSGCIEEKFKDISKIDEQIKEYKELIFKLENNRKEILENNQVISQKEKEYLKETNFGENVSKEAKQARYQSYLRIFKKINISFDEFINFCKKEQGLLQKNEQQ